MGGLWSGKGCRQPGAVLADLGPVGGGGSRVPGGTSQDGLPGEADRGPYSGPA